MNDRLNVNTYELALEFNIKKGIIKKEHRLAKNCVYKKSGTTKSKSYKKGEINETLRSARTKAIAKTEDIFPIIEKALFRDEYMDPIMRHTNTIIGCEIFVTYMFTNGGYYDSKDYISIQKTYNCEPVNISNFMIHNACEIVSAAGVTVTPELIDVFNRIFASIYKTTSLSGGRGVGKGEILKSTCFIDAYKPTKGDICIKVDGIKEKHELKGEQSRIIAESYMMSSGFIGINSKLRKKFPNIVKKDIDYINNPEELFKLPVECRRYFLILVINSWEEKRADIVRTFVDELAPNIFENYEDVIFKDTRAFDDFLMILSLKMYAIQDNFDVLVISTLDKNDNIWEMSVTRDDIENTQKIYKVWNTYIKYDNNYSANGRSRVKQSTLKIRKDL